MLVVTRYCFESLFALIQMLLKLKYSLLVGRKASLRESTKGIVILDLNDHQIVYLLIMKNVLGRWEEIRKSLTM